MKRIRVGIAIVVTLATSIVGMTGEPVAAGRPGTGDAKGERDAKGTDFDDGRYIVTFADDPVASYEGYEAGFPATRPGRGRKVDRNSPAVANWQRHLVGKHDAALNAVGASKLYDYTVANNGVTAVLTGEQAAELAQNPDVVALTLDRLQQPDTIMTPSFLKLGANGGLWSQLGGAKNAGAGIVVGVLDTGIWPENPAFAGNTGIPVPATWRGQCEAGEQFNTTTCNDKLIGARFYTQGFGIRYIATEDYLSPRDGDSHGSRTASTAAGNSGSPVVIDGNNLGAGSGMAPGAKIAAYKVCWTGRPGVGDGCFASDGVAAINDAMLDGVDVINYSIGGGSESDVFDPVAQAFRGASNANVFVANSAGNSGPGASTFDHPAPWVTTVAAATFRRSFQAIELGNGARYVGVSTTGALPSATALVTSVSVKLASASASDAAVCAPGTLDTAKARGKFVQCDRGVVDRIAKSFEVRRAGGVAMVMTNTSPNSLNGDYHPIPSVHVDHVAGAAIKAYITATPAAIGKIVPLDKNELAAAPQVPEIAAFSSRGPSTTTGGDILKPDIAAPGVDVVAAVAPPFMYGRAFDFMSGTSMASPHIAGIGALLMALHPDWLPSEIKSAMMTTTTDTVSSAKDPFAQGAGFVNPNGAANPGLVYPATANDFRSYLVGLGVQFAPPYDQLPAVTASNLNQASISIGKLAGVETVTRRVRNVGTSTATYSATATVPGFTTVVSPSRISLAPGAEASFTVTFTRVDAPLDTWAIGHLVWTTRGKAVRSPIALEPVGVSAPTEVHGDASAGGSTTFDVTPGFTGTLDLSTSGLVGVAPTVESVTTGGWDFDNPPADSGTDRYQVVVAEGTRVARFSLDAADDTADLDLFVYRDGEFLELSASSAADEQITLLDPAAGTYDVYVNGFATPGGSTTYDITNFVVPRVDSGNVTYDPDPAGVTTGQPTTITATWTGLNPELRWFGVVEYAEDAAVATFISIG